MVNIKKSPKSIGFLVFDADFWHKEALFNSSD